MMSGHNPETLFSFELLVKNIRLERHCKVRHGLALGVRLLDFPTLLVYQSRGGSRIKQPQHKEEDKPREYVFNRGKSCFFKMDMNSLDAHLSKTPLSALVLDVTEETPRLVGSCLISLAKAMDRIRQDVTQHGFPSPSCHLLTTCHVLTGIWNLTGERIGTISLSYKLVCLGASLLPHITEMRTSESTGVPGGQQEEHGKEKNKSAASGPLGCSPTLDKSELNFQTKDLSDSKLLLNVDKQSDAAHVTAQSQAESHFTEDLSAFCPPQLYYSNTAQERSINKETENKWENFDLEAFACDDSCSEDEEEMKGSHSQVVYQTRTHTQQLSSSQEGRAVAPNVFRETLKHLPLLNALVTELSQFTGETPHQSMTAHPIQAWTYRPDSPGFRKTPLQPQTHTQYRTGRQTDTDFKIHLQTPRNCSTPIANLASPKMKDHQADVSDINKKASKLHKKKLMFGTTKTFNLRLKQISPLKVKRRECVELTQKETASQKTKGKAKPSRKPMNCSKRRSVLNRSPNLNENIETVIQRVRLDSVPQETITLKQKTPLKKGVPEKPAVSQRALRCIHIPSVDSDSVPLSEDKNDQSEPESKCHSHIIESSRSSKRSSPESLFSDYSINGNAEADYADDFDSLESSYACSPDPLSSPEPSRAKTPMPPMYPDFCKTSPTSESSKKKPVHLPVPIKASNSPHQTLMDTRIIRPRTHASAISFSSSDDDGDGLTSAQTVSSGKQIASNKVQQSSCAERFLSSRGQRNESVEDSNVIQELSADNLSVSSLEAQEVEELENELGSLDFRKGYRHISELVANKLPGYTM